MKRRGCITTVLVAMAGVCESVSCTKPAQPQPPEQTSVGRSGAVASQARAQTQPNPDREAYFRETHIHTMALSCPRQNGLLYSMGFVIATGCLHAAGISIGSIHRWLWGQTVLRMAGGAVALTGAFFMWRAFH